MVGVDGEHPVFMRACWGCVAVVSELGREDFSGSAAESRMADLAWLAPRACRHEAVIEDIMRQTPVLPARLATLFTSIDSLDQFVLDHRPAIADFFSRLGDKQEWAVKGMLSRAETQVQAGLPHSLAAEEPAPLAGARYLQQKRIKAQSERDLTSHLRDFCRQAAATLAARPETFRERKIVGAGAPRAEAEVVLNWAFLLSPSALGEFREHLERLNSDEAFPGLTLTHTGPWPPYSFVPHLSAGEKA
jgi:hypothetical protein